MIDLKKLEDKFNALFESENDESFDKWLEDKRMREIISSLGEGVFINIKIMEHPLVLPSTHFVVNKLLMDNCDPNNSGNTQYAMAA